VPNRSRVLIPGGVISTVRSLNECPRRSRAILTRIRRGERIDHFETVRQRKHGSLIVVSLTVSPVKNAEGKIVGASKIARDITEQKRSQEQIATLAREAEHRSKNLLANVQATVMLSQSDTSEGLKQAIAGRIRALANVHSLFALPSGWGLRPPIIICIVSTALALAWLGGFNCYFPP
jgi:hypothetical protein